MYKNRGRMIVHCRQAIQVVSRLWRSVGAMALCLFVAGCGGDGVSGSYEVTNVNILSDNMEVGEKVRVEVFFETKMDLDGRPDGVQVVVKIPDALGYVPGSSKMYDGSTDESDQRSPDDVVVCPGGDSFLFYDLGNDDLLDSSLGSEQFGIKFEVVGKSPRAEATISAIADEAAEFSCRENFDGEEEEIVTVF